MSTSSKKNLAQYERLAGTLPRLLTAPVRESEVLGGKLFGIFLIGVAQVAIQGARYAAEAIRRRVSGREPQAPFEYHDKGSMATVSRFSAVASIKSFRFSGFFAWVLWLAVHLVYIIGFKHRVTTLLHWAVSFVGRGRSERTITEQQIVARNVLRERAEADRADADRAEAERAEAARAEPERSEPERAA